MIPIRHDSPIQPSEGVRTGEKSPTPPNEMSVRSLVAQQEHLRTLVIIRDRIGRLRKVCGVDAGYGPTESRIRAAAVLMDFESLRTLESVVHESHVFFPYIPGLLSFREVPALAEAVRLLGSAPDVILCDGQGTAHPRGFGLACHLGVTLDIPAIGVAKSRLTGRFEEPGGQRGCWSPLTLGGKTIGAVLRTRDDVRPVFVSPGHKISLATSLRIVLACTSRYRISEPLRQAHALASRTG